MSGMYENVLLIGSENLSKIINYDDRSTAILFGDGAGAVILSKGDKGIIDAVIANKDDKQNAIIIGNGVPVNNPFKVDESAIPAKIQMKGQDVFKFATSICVKSINNILAKNDLSLDDIDYVIPHQANLRIIDYAKKVLKIEDKKIITNVENSGNTSSASIPIALAKMVEENELKRNDKLLLVAFGGGLTYGASLIEY
jgi:3-oxoacyl-[acyl-carrier-protein] synthase-3